MVERVKMSRLDRAKQFAPFDALKGLQETLRLKEYEHDKIAKGELDEDTVLEISSVLSRLSKCDKVYIEFFRDGHSFNVQGNSKLDIINQTIVVGDFKINFDDILKIKKLS